MSKIERGKIDILMITHNRPEYTRKSLGRLLATCDNSMRVWIWHNGEDEATLSVVRELAAHPRVFEIIISPENKKLTEPTNWLWENAKGEFVSKVDDDCILPMGWAQLLRKAHHDEPVFGVIGCCRILEDDFDYDLAKGKINEFSGGHKLLKNCWVQGSGYLLKREIVKQFGLLKPRQTFTDYCVNIASGGYVNGFYFPLIKERHLDDPREPGTLLVDDSSFKLHRPLTAINNDIQTVDSWITWIKNNCAYLQTVSADPRYFSPMNRKMRSIKTKFKSLFLK